MTEVKMGEVDSTGLGAKYSGGKGGRHTLR